MTIVWEYAILGTVLCMTSGFSLGWLACSYYMERCIRKIQRESGER
jgi:hypothetical protein